MAATATATPYRLLTSHFLRQFLANDLIAPDADRSQLLAVLTATVVCLTLFISTVMSFTYVGPLLTPGLAAVLSLDDKFFYLAFGMVVTALVAASQWDALAIDARDAAILEPLPVRAAIVRRAKLSAVAIVGMAAGLAVNLCPSIVFPSLILFTFRQASFLALIGMILAHATFTVAASLFGYLTVVTLREVLTAVLGPTWFARVSPWVQGALIVLLGGSLLLLPPAASRIAHRGFDGWRAMAPPMWFLGAYEMSAGHILIDLPRTAMRPRQAENEQLATSVYRQRQGEFPALAGRAGYAIGSTLLIGAAAYLWNARRRLSLAAVPPAAVHRKWLLVGRLANLLVVRRAAARAGFHFAMAAMWRSNTHRLTLACAAAVGLAMAVLVLSGSNVQSGQVSARLLAAQPLLYGALLVGFRHTIRVPAELRASWGFQLAWRNQQQSFIAGVKSAAIVALVVPALLVLLPLFTFALGPTRALLHAALGLGGAIVMLESLMIQYDKVPFTCTYLPRENMKALAPVYAIAFAIGASIFARLQHAALYDTPVPTLLTLVAVYASLRLVAVTRARLPYVEFDEAPATFQRLGLDG